MNFAEYQKKLEGWTGDAKLFHLIPAYEYEVWNFDTNTPDIELVEYVVVSAVSFPTISRITGHKAPDETLVFASDEQGEVDNYIDIYGQLGTMDHFRILQDMGYIVSQVDRDLIDKDMEQG